MPEESSVGTESIVDGVDAKDIDINKDEGTIAIGNEETGKIVGIPLAEEVVKEVVKPEYVLDKFENEADQAKAYPDLQKKLGEMGQKLGAFQGAPENYELPAIENWEWDQNDESLKNTLNSFKDDGMSQEHAAKYLTMWVNSQQHEASVYEDEMKSLGPDGPQKIANIVNWGKNNLPGDESAVLEAMMEKPTVAGVKLFQSIKGLISTNSIQPPNMDGSHDAAYTVKDWQREFEANYYKGEKIADNPDAQKKWMDKLEKLVGTN